MESCIKLPLEEKELNELVEKAKDYLLMHGICMRQKSAFDRDALHFAPFLLFPSPFPEKEFNLGVELQPVLNELMHKVAHDHDFLEETLKNTIKVDEFTKRLYDIYVKVRKEGFRQPLSLGMMRSDLMLDSGTCQTTCDDCDPISSPYCCFKQVEINTIASGFGWMGPASGLIHRYVLGEIGRRDLAKQVPENKALQGLCEGMLEAWKIYNAPKSVILFVIEDVTFNICDQKFHEFEIRRQNPEVFVVRKTLTEIAKEGKLVGDDSKLVVDGHEVAVVYYRCGYSPDQYHTEDEWSARLMVERSLAIKSPSIHYHLAGTKKVQQRLAEKGMLERFLPGPENASKVEKVRGIFTGLYELNDKVIETVRKSPDRFVVKPQREGGGNNIYGAEINPFLDTIVGTPEQDAYIVMDKIAPPISTNYMVRPMVDKPMLVKTISELGIFGYCIGDEKGVSINKAVGYCLRTKLSHVNEGGVAAGLGALDSPFLIADLDRCCTIPEANDCCSANCETDAV